MSDEKLAVELAQMANECCYRSDGWEKNLSDRFEKALRENRRALFAAADRIEVLNERVRHALDCQTEAEDRAKELQTTLDAVMAFCERAVNFYPDLRDEYEALQEQEDE